MIEKTKREDLRIYVLWAPMLRSDAKERWREDLIQSADITHVWDQDRLVGKWFTENFKSCRSLGPIAWDAYYLFGPDAKWPEESGIHAGPEHIVCGTPVIKEKEALAEAIEVLISPTSK